MNKNRKGDDAVATSTHSASADAQRHALHKLEPLAFSMAITPETNTESENATSLVLRSRSSLRKVPVLPN